MASAKPKKPQTAYFCFMADKRAEIKSSNPDLDHKELVKKMGEEWNKLSEKGKEKYTALANKDKQRYLKEMESYEPTSDDECKKGKKKGGKKAKKEKKEGQPKKPMSAYFFYIGERRATLKEEKPDLGNKEIVIEMGKEWAAMSDKDKAKYVKKAEEDKKRYEKEMKAFKEDDNDDETKEDNEESD